VLILKCVDHDGNRLPTSKFTFLCVLTELLTVTRLGAYNLNLIRCLRRQSARAI